MMKRIAFLMSIVALICQINLNAQQNTLTTSKPGEEGSFGWVKGSEHDFGKIPQGTPVTTTFEFTNTGKSPIVISNVKSSCGCTAPDYSKEPIAPGKKGFVKATFNAASMGVFNKSLTVVSNANEKDVYLTIKGEVVAK